MNYLLLSYGYGLLKKVNSHPKSVLILFIIPIGLSYPFLNKFEEGISPMLTHLSLVLSYGIFLIRAKPKFFVVPFCLAPGLIFFLPKFVSIYQNSQRNEEIRVCVEKYVQVNKLDLDEYRIEAKTHCWCKLQGRYCGNPAPNIDQTIEN